jgi:2,4-diaminopentanoate dehydrogenase
VEADVTRVVSLGLGAIGLGIADALLTKADIELVAAVDASDALAGRDLAEVLPNAPTRLTISNDLSSVLDDDEKGVVVQATSSRLEDIAPQLETIIGHGWNVLSTSEELTHAHAADSTLALHVDQQASEMGVTVLGAGVNPGFLMDVLPLLLSGLCLRVDSIRVRRVVNTNARRPQLQAKVGVGMIEADFEALADAGRLGHVGLRQSAHLIAETLGWTNLHYTESLVPVVAAVETVTPIAAVPEGGVIGQRQLATVQAGGEERVRLELEMYAGADAEDRIDIHGEPSIQQVIPGGVNGDIATASVISNLVEAVADARPGLITMADLLPLACTPARVSIGT